MRMFVVPNRYNYADRHNPITYVTTTLNYKFILKKLIIKNK